MNEQKQISEYPSEEIILEVIKTISENKTETARTLRYIQKNFISPDFYTRPRRFSEIEKQMMNDERVHHIIIELQEEMEKF